MAGFSPSLERQPRVERLETTHVYFGRLAMRCGIAVGLAATLWFGADAPKTASTSEGDAFQGVWQLSGGEADGKALSAMQFKGGKLVIHNDQYSVTLPEK